MEVNYLIIYNKLSDYLKKRNIKYIDLQKELNLSPTIIAKFQKNRSVTTDTIDKVCTFLKVQPGDIMEWVENESEAELLNLERQKAEIEAKISQLKK